MGKWQIDAMLDAALNYIKNNTTRECVCSAQPLTYAEAVTAYKLALKTSLSSADINGPVDGDSSGRKITVSQQTNISVDVSGNATHIALCSDTVLLYVTTCTYQTLSAGNTVSIPAWDIELADAS